MRLLIVGAGALGTLFAVRFAASGAEVTVARRRGSAPSAATATFSVEGVAPAEATVRTVELGRAVGPFDAALLAVKSYDVEAATPALAPLGPAPLLLIQNGLGIAAAAERGLRRGGAEAPAERLVRSIVTLPATLLADGRARQAGVGEVLLPGRPDPPAVAATERWATALADAGLPLRRVADFEREAWRKLLVNAAINPVTADHAIENGRLAEEPWRSQALALLHEAREVARAEGHEFGAAEAEHDLFRVVQATASNRSSMLQDLDRGRATEIEAISGELLRRGERAGLAMPHTRRALERVRRRAAAPAGARAAEPT